MIRKRTARRPSGKNVGLTLAGLTALGIVLSATGKKTSGLNDNPNENINTGKDLLYFDVAYISPKTHGGEIVDDQLMEIRIAGKPPKDTFPIGTEVILSGTDSDDGTYDLFEDVRGYSGDGTSKNPPACWLIVQHNTKAPTSGQPTPNASVII